MNRRTALKNLTMSLGYTVAAPTIFNMLSACTAEADTWSPLFLSSEEKHMVTQLVDIILPASDTPGALDVNVPQFLDMMYQDIEIKENQDQFKKGASIFSKKFKTQFGSEVAKGDKEQFETLLASYFDISDEETATVFKEQRLPIEKLTNPKIENRALYKFLISVRTYTLFGYFTSEKVGETVLNYDPVPGVHISCMPLEDVLNGRAWSL
ncbi:Gluconate 2-dehydrogenase subunit 3 [Algibacter lectus]|uniref:gluconate 2-dehydrogenase subunit 3 family protein n=1 Tax=Algibacter lectus TaxID=221126 RepID=UPI0008E0D6DA|nr:gluconate 2-dehydrogenase subunit 3 family protein [Algibacter lectus]SFB96152.1 Gluconate 2-dehydrogenase subunit 3 [Algibacter lectus]